MSIKLTEPLETPRLFIRQFTQEDYDPLVKKLKNADSEEDFPLFPVYKESDVYCFLLQIICFPKLLVCYLKVYVIIFSMIFQEKEL